VYEPLASGLLSGRPVTIQELRRTWADLEEWTFYDRLCAPGKLERSAEVASGVGRVAARLELPPAQVAVAWVLSRREVTAAICGSRNPLTSPRTPRSPRCAWTRRRSPSSTRSCLSARRSP